MLYIGKTRTLRDRFGGGHKALLGAFTEELKVTDIRIAFYQLDFTQWIQLSSELESLIIQAINPPYNVCRLQAQARLEIVLAITASQTSAEF